MRKWWDTAAGAWGLLVTGLGVGGMLTYISPPVGITVCATMTLIGIVLIARAHRGKTKHRILLKKGGSKVIIALGIFIIIAGIVGGGFLLKSQLKIESSIKATVVRCCIQGNAYQVWATNPPDSDKDTVFISLGTSSMITNIKALMGASLPTIIEGGVNANFITFKISELPPNVSLSYIIEVGHIAEEPRNLAAWSETTKSNIAAEYIGRCPQHGDWGPEETVP